MFTFSHFQDIENRIDTCILDSLITLELLNKGIDTDYEYGIFSPSRNRMVIEKTGNYSKKLLENNLAFILFPSDVFSNPDYLMIYFPHERNFLFKQLSGILTISVFLILIIIVSFLFTINFIFKEKKFAEMKTDFINNMTHEFKTPISTIALACEALKDKDLKMMKDVSDSYISIVNEENKRLGAMAEKILQTAVLEKGKLKLNKEEIDIHHIIFDVIKNIGIQVEINDGRIVKDFRASNPVIEADKVHLTNVIFNLLENANKYSPTKPLITIRTKNIPGGIEVSVKDNGVGINKSDQKKIFDKLYRVPTGDIHNFKGFGLGLSYVKAIVAKHGGTVTLESEINVGSTFRVFLPEK
jgi:two-component system phosphate regulon sensor histidine kinase PhoR